MNEIENVLIINDFDYIQGGASKVAIQTANLLSNKGYNVIFFCGDSRDNNELNKNIKVFSTNQGEALKNKNKIAGFINGIYNFKAKKMLIKILNNLDANKTIIHIHGWTKCLSSSVIDVCFKKKFKTIITLHDYFSACPNGGYFNYKKNQICQLKPLSIKCVKCNCDSRNYFFKIYRVIRQIVQNNFVKLNKKIQYAVVISDFSYSILKETLNDNIKIKKINNPIDLPKNESHVDFHKNNYFLYVGRLSKEKGVERFCEAITNLNLKGIVVGDGSEKDYLENKYKNIEFTGWKNSNEVKEYIKNAKCLIFPSKWYETAGLTVLEAQVEGIPVIVSKECAGSEFVTIGKTGYIFENKKELEKYISIIDDLNFIPDDYSIYSEEKYIKSLIEFYKEK